VATLDRWVDKYVTFHDKFSQDLTCQKSLKSVIVWRSYSKNRRWTFLGHAKTRCSVRSNSPCECTICLSPITCRPRFGFCWPLCAFINYYIFVLMLYDEAGRHRLLMKFSTVTETNSQSRTVRWTALSSFFNKWVPWCSCRWWNFTATLETAVPF